MENLVTKAEKPKTTIEHVEEIKIGMNLLRIRFNFHQPNPRNKAQYLEVTKSGLPKAKVLYPKGLPKEIEEGFIRQTTKMLKFNGFYMPWRDKGYNLAKLQTPHEPNKMVRKREWDLIQ